MGLSLFYIIVYLRLAAFPIDVFFFSLCLYITIRKAEVNEYPHICFVVRLRVPIGCSTELNHFGHEFLQRLFDKYDEVSRNPGYLWAHCEFPAVMQTVRYV